MKSVCKVFILLLITCFLCSFKENVTVIEKVYLHLDRHFYLSGDDIWLKAYLIDGQTNKLSPNSSRILYVELISPESRMLDRLILYVDSTGCASGDFRLRQSAVSGKYRIRAYTKWMLNFGDIFVFEKEIEVKNPDEMHSTKKPKNKKQQEIIIDPEDVEIEFFPESGSLIENIENIMAFKAVDISGKERDVSGGIISSKGDTVARFTSEYLGMGKFAITPKYGEFYYAFFIHSGVSHSSFAQFPEAIPEGMTINLTDFDSAFNIEIRTNSVIFNKYAGKKFILNFKHSEIQLFGHEFILENESKILRAPKSLLPQGITRMTLYDEDWRPYCERLVYVEKETQINVELKPENDSLSIIKLTAQNDKPVQACFSISITNNTVPDETFNIESYIWLESEIKGKIESPTAYFDRNNTNRFKHIDLLLMTQGWRDFVWLHVDSVAFAGFRPEKGLQITGRVKKLIGKSPYVNANISMFFPHIGIEKGVRFTQTDSSGNYNFGYVDFWGCQDIYVNSRVLKGRKNNIKDRDAGQIFVNPLCMQAEKFPVKIWQQYISTDIYMPIKNLPKRDSKLTDTAILDPVVIKGRNPKGWMMSNRDITQKDEKQWVALDFYVGGQVPCLRIPCGRISVAHYNYFDNNEKKIFNRIPPSKISMKEVDKVLIYKKDKFSVSEYTIDVYARGKKFTRQNYATTAIVENESGAGYHTVITDKVNYSSFVPALNGYYEARRFYKPKFKQIVERKNFFGTFFWETNLSTDKNGEAIINYNPEKQDFEKIKIEGITGDGIPFVYQK